MATLKETSNGTPYFEITADELIEYSDNLTPVCDECMSDISFEEKIILIPILNQAYCPTCAPKVLDRMKRYPEDTHIEQRRVEFYRNYFGV